MPQDPSPLRPVFESVCRTSRWFASPHGRLVILVRHSVLGIHYLNKIIACMTLQAEEVYSCLDVAKQVASEINTVFNGVATASSYRSPSHDILCICTHNERNFINWLLKWEYVSSDDTGSVVSDVQLYGRQARPHGLHGAHQVRLQQGRWLCGFGLYSRHSQGQMIILIRFERLDQVFYSDCTTRISRVRRGSQPGYIG